MKWVASDIIVPFYTGEINIFSFYLLNTAPIRLFERRLLTKVNEFIYLSVISQIFLRILYIFLHYSYSLFNILERIGFDIIMSVPSDGLFKKKKKDLPIKASNETIHNCSVSA